MVITAQKAPDGKIILSGRAINITKETYFVAVRQVCAGGGH